MCTDSEASSQEVLTRYRAKVVGFDVTADFVDGRVGERRHGESQLYVLLDVVVDDTPQFVRGTASHSQ